MPVKEGVKLLAYARKAERDDRIYLQWCSLSPFMYMHLLKFMTFTEFRDAVTGDNIDMRPEEEIIAEIKALHAEVNDGNL